MCKLESTTLPRTSLGALGRAWTRKAFCQSSRMARESMLRNGLWRVLSASFTLIHLASHCSCSKQLLPKLPWPSQGLTADIHNACSLHHRRFVFTALILAWKSYWWKSQKHYAFMAPQPESVTHEHKHCRQSASLTSTCLRTADENEVRFAVWDSGDLTKGMSCPATLLLKELVSQSKLKHLLAPA